MTELFLRMRSLDYGGEPWQFEMRVGSHWTIPIVLGDLEDWGDAPDVMTTTSEVKRITPVNDGTCRISGQVLEVDYWQSGVAIALDAGVILTCLLEAKRPPWAVLGAWIEGTGCLWLATYVENPNVMPHPELSTPILYDVRITSIQEDHEDEKYITDPEVEINKWYPTSTAREPVAEHGLERLIQVTLDGDPRPWPD